MNASTKSDRKRVVITGLGLVTPLGLGTSATWQGLTSNRSGIGMISQFDASQFPVQIAGEVQGFSAEALVGKKDLKKMQRFIQMALVATDEAMEDSGIKNSLPDATREQCGVFVGVGMGGLQFIEEQNAILLERGPSRISPFFIPSVITNLAAGQISIRYALGGPNYSITSACASGAHSIGEAFRYIQRGLTPMMLAGGAEATVCPLAISGFAAMRALSTRNDAPQTASRPWDRNRDGFVLSEGAAILVLEEYEHAKLRGAKIYAEVMGYGASADAHHMTNPSPGGEGAARAMRLCLKDGGINADTIDYINAHGTSTPAGDEIEAQAIKTVFKDHAYKLWVSSTKSMLGHTLGAAGAIESAICVLAMTHSVVPGTLNLEEPDEGCDLDFVPHAARDRTVRLALNNSFGFGGTNACLVFGKV